MDAKHDFSTIPHDRMVYVRSIKADDLPSDVQDGLHDQDDLYAVHNAEGERLAVIKDRKLAFVLAREHNYTPVMIQ